MCDSMYFFEGEMGAILKGKDVEGMLHEHARLVLQGNDEVLTKTSV